MTTLILPRAEAIDVLNKVERFWLEQIAHTPSYYNSMGEWRSSCIGKSDSARMLAVQAALADEGAKISVHLDKDYIGSSSPNQAPKSAKERGNKKVKRKISSPRNTAAIINNRRNKTAMIEDIEMEEEILEDIEETIDCLRALRKLAKKQGKATSSYTERIALAKAEEINTKRKLVRLYLGFKSISRKN